MISISVKNNNYVSLELTEITMKKLQLLGIARALILFAMINSANAAIIDIDDTSVTGTDQSYTRMLIDDTSLESPGIDTHTSLWLLLIMVFVFGILSETFHRRHFNQ